MRNLMQCKICNIIGSLSMFPKKGFRKGKQQYVHTCKECFKVIRTTKDKAYVEYVRKMEPWRITWWNIRKRCKHDSGYKDKCNTLTLTQVKLLWLRDKANELNRPSIDRKDNSKGYSYENCQFIELSINSVKDKRKKL